MSAQLYATLTALLFLNMNVFGQGTQLLRQPTLSENHIVFVYANDLWIVDRAGGNANRLTSNEGSESVPQFSKDGKTVAFSAQYQGNTDVYIVPVDGGNPERLTWHPGGDFVQGWTPDGKILFQSGRKSHPTETATFYTVDMKGQVASFPVTRAAYGEVSEDGKYLAYTPITSWDPEWRNYRGGQAMPIWIQNMSTDELIQTPQNDRERHLYPVWIGSKVYYLSERDYTSNIWSFDVITQQETQITFHKKFDVKSLDAHGNDIIYEQGGYLHLKEGGNPSKQLDIVVNGDMNFAIPRWESLNSFSVTNANLSPNGKRAIFEYRGELITVPKKEGSHRNLTNTSGVADRAPIWSPKGDEIAYFSDLSGEYQLIIADQFGKVKRSLDIPESSFYYTPDWSPDGEKIAFTDTHYNVWYVDLKSDTFHKVDADSYAHPNRTLNPKWSPGSRYITYVKQQNSHFKAAYIYDTRDKKSIQVTAPLADVITPVFDQSGDYLYYLASTDYGLGSGWLDMSSFDPSITRTLYITTLNEEVLSPFLPKSDDEEIIEEEGDDSADEGETEATEEEEEQESIEEIQFSGITKRMIPVSNVSGEFVGLQRAPEGAVLVFKNGDNGASCHKYDFEAQELSEYVSGVSAFTTNVDGTQALYRIGGSWHISSIVGKPNPQEDALNFNIKVKVDPIQEYQQIFKEGWRFMRDFLYVDNVHGAPWDDIWEWYAPWIEHVRHRSDLNYVVDILSGEVAIGHSYVYGGDMPDLDRVRVGLLGADYAKVNGKYKIEKIYTGESFNPNLYAPLFQPGLDVKEGDFITSVNGVSLNREVNIYSLFEETVGEVVHLEVQRGTDEPKEVMVKPVGNERGLRTIDWVEGNRRKVDELSNGELAYVYVPNTGFGGFTSFNRYYFSQQDKKGVVIDERNNGGGSAADYMIDIMNRKLFGYFNSKSVDNRPWTTPMAGIWGPKVMIINERAGSGGDLLPYMFKAADLGPIVGTRTWGGLVGTWDTPPFIDGGGMIAPRGGFFDVDGEWAVEGEGVSPDIEVIQDPKARKEGRDPQLERAVQEALKLLQNNRFEMKPEPAAPVRWKRPDGYKEER